MKIPEPMFVVINRVVSILLKSPFHALMSKSVLLINYTGRKSGKAYSTPVRYLVVGETIRCFTAQEIQWWRNVAANPTVSLLVQGQLNHYNAKIPERDPQQVQQLLVEFLAVFPQDAVYQDIRLNSDGSLNAEDLARASHNAVAVEFERVTP